MIRHLSILFLFLICSSCEKSSDPQTSNSEREAFVVHLLSNFTQLPEGLISQSTDNSVFAAYTGPTRIYAHGVLGDIDEATQLVVGIDGQFYDLQLTNPFVFEDLRPRLYDVDKDGALEFLTIRTRVTTGAGIVIYKLIDGALVEYANVPEYGIPNRWLNFVAINDIDNDGTVELAWIETPHIGGVLKVARVEEGTLSVLAETGGYSNHANGQRNMCLSVLREIGGQKVIYVPNQDRCQVVGFTLENEALVEYERIDLEVDFTNTLESQYDFGNTIEDEDHCITVE